VSRFSQAISEGDGISVVPVLLGDPASLAGAAEAAGAEAIAVDTDADAEAVRAAAALPVLVREPVRDLENLHRLHALAVDAFVIAFHDVANEAERLEELHAEALELEVDCALAVEDDEELQQALERVDPDIVLISLRPGTADEEELERALDLLPDVPAGKLVVVETDAIGREQVLALERAGVDALIVRNLGGAPDFGPAVEDLVGGTRPGR
jgi:indole-3-glycerol phosphate synthase